jgi:prepilin-type N-terminal cleavage/methylation domain-containing protein
MKKKRAFTLLEIMIVIALITLITGVIGYNMRDTLDRGRAFRTEQAISQLHDMLLLCLAEGKEMGNIIGDEKKLLEAVKSAGLAKDPEKLLQDGWGNPLIVKPTENNDDFDIQSERWNKYKAAHK